MAISAARREGLEALLPKADRTLFAEGASLELGALVAPLRLPMRDEAEALDVTAPTPAVAGG